MSTWLVDTSVAVPAVLTSHDAHAFVSQRLEGRELRLTAHSAIETYSVLTRLPGDARLRPEDAAQLLGERFGAPATLPAPAMRKLVAEMAGIGIAGGAAYDALIAATVRSANGSLLTRDRRAAATYAAFGVQCELLV